MVSAATDGMLPQWSTVPDRDVILNHVAICSEGIEAMVNSRSASVDSAR